MVRRRADRRAVPQAQPIDRAHAVVHPRRDASVLCPERLVHSLHQHVVEAVEAVDPKGEKFDPTKHEALSTQPVEGTESGVVVEVLQKGYALGDQLVRPARVVVSS